MKYIISIILLVVFSLPLYSQEVPDDFYVEYHLWGWYGPPCNDIKYFVSKDSSYFEVNCVNSHINRIPLSINEQELFNLYNIVKDNNFNTILAESREYAITDIGYSRMEINLNNVNHVIFTDGHKHINPESRKNFSGISKAIIEFFPDLKKDITLKFSEDLSQSDKPFSITFDNGNVVYYDGGDFYYKGAVVNLFKGNNVLKINYDKNQNEKIFFNVSEKMKELYFYTEDNKIKFEIK